MAAQGKENVLVVDQPHLWSIRYAMSVAKHLREDHGIEPGMFSAEQMLRFCELIHTGSIEWPSPGNSSVQVADLIAAECANT